MHFTSLMRILKQTLYLFVAIISIIPCISVFIVILSIREAHTKFDTENDTYYNESIDYMEGVSKKYIPFLDLEAILSMLIKNREYIVIAWLIMCLPIVIYNLPRSDYVRGFVRFVNWYLVALVNWFFRLFHAKPAVKDNRQFRYRCNRINRNYRYARGYKRDLIKLCRLQYQLVLTVVELEKRIREYYISNLVELRAIHQSLSAWVLENRERIPENRDANCPPHRNADRGLRLSPTRESPRGRGTLMRRDYPRNPEQAQGRCLSPLLLELRRIGRNHGQDWSQQTSQMQ